MQRCGVEEGWREKGKPKVLKSGLLVNLIYWSGIIKVESTNSPKYDKITKTRER